MSTYSMTRQSGKNFLEIRLDEGECEDSIVVGMLENNEIRQSIPMQILHQGDDTVYRYNISGLMALKFIYQENMTRKRFLGIIEGILESLLDAEEYMIEPCSVDWDYANIYVDEKHNRAKLIYLPLERENESFSIYRFFHELIFYARLDMSENSAYHSELIHFMNSSNEGNFSLSDFLLLVRKLNSEAEQKTLAENPRAANRVEYVQQSAERAKEMKKEQQREQHIKLADITEDRSASKVQRETAASVEPPKRQESWADEWAEPRSEQAYGKLESGGMFKFGFLNKFSSLMGEKNAEAKAVPADDFGFDIPGEERASVKKHVESKREEAPASVKKKSEPAQEERKKAGVAHKTPSADKCGKSTSSASPLKGNATVYFDQDEGNMNGGRTIMMIDDPAQKQRKTAFLIRKKNGERIHIQMVNGFFRIGSSTERELEYVIQDNMHVSRFHAQITQRDGIYYLLDMNSSNGTTLNGAPVFSNAEQPLENGDRIRFANDEYEFILE